MVGFTNVSRQRLFGLGIFVVAQCSVELPNMWDDKHCGLATPDSQVCKCLNFVCVEKIP